MWNADFGLKNKEVVRLYSDFAAGDGRIKSQILFTKDYINTKQGGEAYNG
jgi:hypothetical protein